MPCGIRASSFPVADARHPHGIAAFATGCRRRTAVARHSRRCGRSLCWCHPLHAQTHAPASSRGSAGPALYAIGAYVLWGFLPDLLHRAGARPARSRSSRGGSLFSLVFCALLIAVHAGVAAVRGAPARPPGRAHMGLAGRADLRELADLRLSRRSPGRSSRRALGYFINPIVTVLLGVLVLRERLNASRSGSRSGISIVAVIVLAIGYGSCPGSRSCSRSRSASTGSSRSGSGRRSTPCRGLTLETAWLAPLAIVQLVFVGMTTGLTIGTAGAWHTVLLVSAGAVTAVPLLLFAAASRRLPLIYMGFIQYFAPFIQFLVGRVGAAGADAARALDRVRPRLARAHRAHRRPAARGAASRRVVAEPV